MINRVFYVNLSKISDLANEKGLSLTGLENELGISHRTIMRWKNSCANANMLGIVADYFGVTIDDLLEKR